MTNLAYDYESYYDKTEDRVSKRDENKKKNAEKVDKSAKRTKFLARSYAITFVWLLVGLCLFSVDDLQTLSSLQAEIKLMRMENLAVEKKVREAEATVERLKNSASIEEIAMEKLGMIYPTEDNKVYINSLENQIVRKPKKEESAVGIISNILGGR